MMFAAEVTSIVSAASFRSNVHIVVVVVAVVAEGVVEVILGVVVVVATSAAAAEEEEDVLAAAAVVVVVVRSCCCCGCGYSSKDLCANAGMTLSEPSANINLGSACVDLQLI